MWTFPIQIMCGTEVCLTWRMGCAGAGSGCASMDFQSSEVDRMVQFSTISSRFPFMTITRMNECTHDVVNVVSSGRR